MLGVSPTSWISQTKATSAASQRGSIRARNAPSAPVSEPSPCSSESTTIRRSSRLCSRPDTRRVSDELCDRACRIRPSSWPPMTSCISRMIRLRSSSSMAARSLRRTSFMASTISCSRAVTSKFSLSAFAVAASNTPRARAASDRRSANGKNMTAAPSDTPYMKKKRTMTMSAIAARSTNRKAAASNKSRKPVRQ